MRAISGGRAMFVALVLSFFCVGVPIASAAFDAQNARRVNGLEATKFTTNAQARAGKLVATNGAGLLPNNVIARAPSAADLVCGHCVAAGELKTTNNPLAGLVLGFASGGLRWQAVQRPLIAACSGSGQAIQSVTASGNPGCGTFWSTSGNSGTSSSNFLGTTDGQPLNLDVNSQRALRLEPTSSSPNVIGGFSGNSVASGAVGATIGGGGDNTNANRVTDDFGAVGGGRINRAGDNAGTPSDSPYATVAGGVSNTASGTRSAIGGGEGNTTAGALGVVGGGAGNNASQSQATVAGGVGNTASGTSSAVGGGSSNNAAGQQATIAGGDGNTAFGTRAAVGGGGTNTASGTDAAIPGGQLNIANGTDSLAAGQFAQAANHHTFVWSDGSAGTSDTGLNSFVARATGGFTFYTGTNNTTGATLGSGSGSWASLSDRHSKDAIRPVSGRSVLRKLRTLPMHTWSYRAEPGGVRHLGPMAQSFHRRFGLGASGRYITDVDAQGVAMAGVRGLLERVSRQRHEIRSQRHQNRAQNRRIATLEREVARLSD